MVVIKIYAHFLITVSAILLTAALNRIEYISGESQLVLVYAAVIILIVGFAYEWLQAITPEVIKEHDGYDAFVKDSKRDIAQMFLGLLVGGMLAILIYKI